MLALSVAGEAIPGSRGCRAAPRAFIAGIGPEPCGLRLAGAGGQHADRRVIGKDRLGRQDMATDGLGQRFQQGCRLADPVRQGRSVEVDTFPVEDLALAIEWQMVGILVDQHMGQQTRAGATAFDRTRRERRLHEAFTAGAGQAGSHDPVHDEAAGDVFQFFRDIFPDPAQAPAAIGAGLGTGRQLNFHPRDVIRDRTTLGTVLLLDVRQLHPRRHRGGGDLAGLQGQLKLLGGLGRRTKPVRPMPGQLVPQLLDQDRLRLHLRQKPRGEAAQLLGVFRQGQGLIQHVGSLSHCIPCGNPSLAGHADYPAAKGCHVRRGARQSIPSKSIDNGAGVSATFPSLVLPKNCRLLSRELLYTALTRSREQLVLLIEGDDATVLFDLTRPERSETARRNTNIFQGVVRVADDNVPFAQHLIHRTEKGHLVRSKSELVIANMLFQLGIPYEYERVCDGTAAPGRLRPDFSFVTDDGDLIVWEHLGMLSRPDYKRGWDWKREWYQVNGFSEGSTLFTSTEDSETGLDSAKLKETANAIKDLLG
jgi:hypothetical protein